MKSLSDLLEKVAVPLLTIDRADLWIVRASESEVHLHVGGAYSGCPGVEFVRRHLFAPLVAEVYPKAELTVSSGRVPADAQRIG